MRADLHLLVEAQLSAHPAQQFHRCGDVLQVWHVTDSGGLFTQQASHHDRQNGIFGA